VIRDNVCHTEIEHRLSSWSQLYSEFLVELNKASEDAVIDVVEKMYVVYGLERLAGTDQCRFGVGLSRSWSVQRTRGWPGRHLQSLPSERPDARPTWQCRALCAGVPWVSRSYGAKYWQTTSSDEVLNRWEPWSTIKLQILGPGFYQYQLFWLPACIRDLALMLDPSSVWSFTVLGNGQVMDNWTLFLDCENYRIRAGNCNMFLVNFFQN